MINKYEYIKGKKMILADLLKSKTVKNPALFWSGLMATHIEIISKLPICERLWEEFELLRVCTDEYNRCIYENVDKAERRKA